MDNYNKVLNNFYTLINKKNLADFLKFVALHPEVSIDNCALLYAENEKPEEIYRYFVHKGQADVLKLDEKPQAMLRVKCVVEDQLGFYQDILYMYDGDPVNKTDLRSILDRLGYAAMPDVDLEVPDIRSERRDDAKRLQFDEVERDQIIYYPKKWNQEQLDNYFVEFLVDKFWDAFSKRYLDNKEKPLVDVTMETWVKYYREAVIYMARVWLGMTNPTLTKHFWSFIKNDGIIPNVNVSEKRYRLTVLSVIFSEFTQIIEGEHFTLFETDIFRACNGDIYSDDYNVLFRDLRILDNVYSLMLERYYNYPINKIPLEYIHLYPCFSLPIAKKNKSEIGNPK